MSDDSDAPTGVPAWVVTFADLMTLLMCFYVLMLSFSEMDVAKFKQLSGSVREAFGVQTDVNVKSLPRGTSIIAHEFTPGRPEPTVLNSVRQFTINSSRNSLDVGTNARLQKIAAEEHRAEEQAAQLRAALSPEIEQGKLVIRREGPQVVIQILERDSFASGSADVDPQFLPTLARIGGVLAGIDGALTIAGHTDDVPISTSRFRSNWDLSAARAASVAQALLAAGIEPARIMISGHADTEPRVPNDTPEHRALNRRIDITLLAGKTRHGDWDESAPAAAQEVAPLPDAAQQVSPPPEAALSTARPQEAAKRD